MSDWTPLRDHLRESMAEQLDDKILHDPDPACRALLAANRDRVLALLTDQAELIAMRRIVAERGKRKRKPRAKRGGMQLN
jgi:hypothetical protein